MKSSGKSSKKGKVTTAVRSKAKASFAKAAGIGAAREGASHPKSGGKGYGPVKGAEAVTSSLVQEPPVAFVAAVAGRFRSGAGMRSGIDKIQVIRKGVPYDAIEALSERVESPVKLLLEAFDLPQTTYNKKKRDGDMMSSRETELLLYIEELVDYGLDVFNDESEKFLRWLRIPNLTLGGVSPISLFDSVTGIQEVRNCLGRIEHGISA